MIDPTKHADLLDLLANGQPACCEVLQVEWDADDADETRYYGSQAFNELPPFHNISLRPVDPRIMGNPFREYEINPDLRTETINIEFSDLDREIRGKFQTFGSGVRCELFLYYPDVDLLVSMWFGQLQAPDMYGWKTVKAKATNGFRSREQPMPRRNKPKECTSNFGGRLPDVLSIRTNLCPYDRHVGGSAGLLDGGSPFIDCPRLSEANCIERYGHSLFYGGFNTDASATVSNNQGYLAQSKGNASALKSPVRAIFGSKIVRGNQLLLWRRELGASNPNHNWVATIWEVGEGPNRSVRNIKVNEKFIEQIHLSIRVGTRGQPALTGYNQGGTLSNFSKTASVMARYGWVNAAEISPPDLSMECVVDGFSDIAVFSNTTTHARQWTNDRVWSLLECYTNQTFGLGYAFSRFDIQAFIDTSLWSRQGVQFQHTFPDGEVFSWSGSRTMFDVIMEARPAAEQIEDICRSGGMSVPFQHDSKFTIRPITVATADELTNAKVFTDQGENVNIILKDEPQIDARQTPNDKIINEIKITFEDAAGAGVERPIIVDDPNQKLLAGRALGENNLKSIPKNYAAFGVTRLGETLKLGHRIMRFGEFDTGGTQNNLRVSFQTPVEHVLALRRYDIIKIGSDLLTGFLSPQGVQFEYFRIIKMAKKANGIAQVTAQAYNHVAYTAFETVINPTPPVPGPGTPTEPGPEPWPCQPTFSVTYNATTGHLNVIPIPQC